MFKTWVPNAFLYFGFAQLLWNWIASMERRFQDAIQSRLPLTGRFYIVSCSLAANFNCFSPSLRSLSAATKAIYLTGLYLGERERPVNELKAWKWLSVHLLKLFHPVTFCSPGNYISFAASEAWKVSCERAGGGGEILTAGKSFSPEFMQGSHQTGNSQFLAISCKESLRKSRELLFC